MFQSPKINSTRTQLQNLKRMRLLRIQMIVNLMIVLHVASIMSNIALLIAMNWWFSSESIKYFFVSIYKLQIAESINLFNQKKKSQVWNCTFLKAYISNASIASNVQRKLTICISVAKLISQNDHHYSSKNKTNGTWNYRNQ